jgi:hypothetical protein
MTPEFIAQLAAAEREFEHTCSTGWILRARIPTQEEIRRVAIAANTSEESALKGVTVKLALQSVVSWKNVTLEDIGLPAVADTKPTDPAPCTPGIVSFLLGDRLEILDLFVADFVARVNVRTERLKADEKNSASA